VPPTHPQLAKYLGANVIGTVSTPAKASEARAAGADHVLLSTDPSPANVQAILDLTGGKGVHGVYDGVGADTWEENFEVVRSRGTIVTFGNSSGPVPAFEPLKLMPKSLKVTRPTLNAYVAEREEFEGLTGFLYRAVEEGALKVSWGAGEGWETVGPAAEREGGGE
jgi:NADPH2:quinone reductase